MLLPSPPRGVLLTISESRLQAAGRKGRPPQCRFASHLSRAKGQNKKSSNILVVAFKKAGNLAPGGLKIAWKYPYPVRKRYLVNKTEDVTSSVETSQRFCFQIQRQALSIARTASTIALR